MSRFPSRYLIMDDGIVNKRAAAYIRRDIMQALLDSRQAYDLTWARATRCPCRANTQTEQPDPTCIYCYGVLGNLPGWRYVHPHPEKFPEGCLDAVGSVDFAGGERIRGLLSAMGADDQRHKEGTWLSGSATLSVRSDVELGYWDRLVMVDAVMPYDQMIVRGTSSTLAVGRDESTQLRYPIVKLLDCRSTTARYRERADYTLDLLQGTLTWLPGKGPANGIRYSLRYHFHPRWIIQDLPRATVGHRFPPKEFGLRGVNHFGQLPQRAAVKLDFLL
jgi:hypothetical protein